MIYINKDIEIDVDEFISSCDDEDINEIIDILSELGFLRGNMINSKNLGRMEKDFQDKVEKLKDVFYNLSDDEIGLIEALVKKYC